MQGGIDGFFRDLTWTSVSIMPPRGVRSYEKTPLGAGRRQGAVGGMGSFDPTIIFCQSLRSERKVRQSGQTFRSASFLTSCCMLFSVLLSRDLKVEAALPALALLANRLRKQAAAVFRLWLYT